MVVFVKPNAGRPGCGGPCKAKLGPPCMWWYMWNQIWAALYLVVYVKPHFGRPGFGGLCEAKFGRPKFGGLCEAKFGRRPIWWSMWSQIWAALNLVVYVKPNLGRPEFGGLCEAKFGKPLIWWSMWSQIWAALDLVVYVKPNSGGPNLVVYVKPNSGGLRFGGLCEAKFGPPWIWWSMWSQIRAVLDLVVYVKPNSGDPHIWDSIQIHICSPMFGLISEVLCHMVVSNVTYVDYILPICGSFLSCVVHLCMNSFIF